MRQSWDNYFIEIANVVASRSTCDRKHVGAVIVKNKRIISTGFNGSLPGLAHCDDPEAFLLCPRCGAKRKLNAPEHPQLQCQEHISCLGFDSVIQYGGHDIENNHCLRTVHGEINAIAQAARMGLSTDGATLYCNCRPCWTCFKAIVSAGITEIVYEDEYDSESSSRIVQASKEIPGFVLRKI